MSETNRKSITSSKAHLIIIGILIISVIALSTGMIFLKMQHTNSLNDVKKGQGNNNDDEKRAKTLEKAYIECLRQVSTKLSDRGIGPDIRNQLDSIEKSSDKEKKASDLADLTKLLEKLIETFKKKRKPEEENRFNEDVESVEDSKNLLEEDENLFVTVSNEEIVQDERDNDEEIVEDESGSAATEGVQDERGNAATEGVQDERGNAATEGVQGGSGSAATEGVQGGSGNPGLLSKGLKKVTNMFSRFY